MKCPSTVDASDSDDEEAVIWEEDSEISDSDQNRIASEMNAYRGSNLLVSTGLGIVGYELQVSVRRTAKDLVNKDNKIIFDQLQEYSRHLERFGSNRLLQMKEALAIALRDDLQDAKTEEEKEGKSVLVASTEEALVEIASCSSAVERTLFKVKNFFSDYNDSFTSSLPTAK